MYKAYDSAQTPYQRLLKYGTLSEDEGRDLQTVYQFLDSATLIDQINYSLDKLWELEEKGVLRKSLRIHKI